MKQLEESKLTRELNEAKALIAIMKPIVDGAVEWSQVKDGTVNYPDYVSVNKPSKNQYLYGMCVELDLYNSVKKYAKVDKQRR
ncbi:uncharacterized membrane protein (DUF441 family) [Sporomusaceae bacterium BoRhaA]|uniref:hypothetical protein n=1 Tax=Pelorhabdus rhamnosifermentans TaxID=2772457 RepID=UPI001C05F5F3|nr:hypothetical protein [Pelorhabdus rhamnosifermentans]MBU2702698.1 uncharacterized membrane protein (DUF441 family) [Pelorhabdus rhamnosifermentans]